MKMVLEMSLLTFSNRNIQFAEKKLIWRFYTAKKALPTTQRVELIEQKKFAKATWNKNIKAFVIHVSSLGLGSKMIIHPAWKAQIALMLAKEFIILPEYLDFINVSSKASAKVLPERTRINEHVFELEDDKQPSYRPIYSLGLVELKILKTYIKTNLANSFIQSLQSLTGTPIRFVYKPNDNLQFCINYRGLNNLIIKNWYSLPLIGKSLDRLGQVKCFTQLDFTSSYHWIRIKKGDK